MTRLAGRPESAPLEFRRGRSVWLVLVALALPLVSCDAFNPAFLSLVTPAGVVPTIENPSGHVVLSVINNAEMDERLIDYLDASLNFTDAQKRELRPRIRLRIRATFTDGSFQTIEFVTGTPGIVDPDFNAESFTDLDQNTLDNAVVVCDVASVQIEPGTEVEVFIPVELTEFELVESQTTGGGTVVEFEERQRIPPQFRGLQVDDVDEDGNTILQRNVGIRNVPTPIGGLLCGSVVAIVINGALSVPFLDGVSSDPSYDVGDEATVAGIGGRYEFQVFVQ